MANKQKRKGKKPKVGFPLKQPPKKPHAPAEKIAQQERISFSFKYFDNYNWRKKDANSKQDDFLAISEKLKNYDSQLWSSFQRSIVHPMKVDVLIKEAQRRIRELNRPYIDDTLYEFRITRPERLWAVRLEGKAFILWWDPEHNIYPTDK